MSDEAAAIAEPAQVQEPKAPKRITKVLKLEILKPAGEMKWAQLVKLLRDARYRVFRLANLAVSEAYPTFTCSGPAVRRNSRSSRSIN